MELAVPSSPIASPLLSAGMISDKQAAWPVGLKPVEKPCASRSSKKPDTDDNNGYNRLQTKQTKDPTIITGTRPTVSANFPLNGREAMAVRVNNEIMKPLYCPPPMLVRYAGRSGMSMLKLAKKSNELMQRSQNWVLQKVRGSIILCSLGLFLCTE